MKHFASEAALWVKQDKGIELDYSLDSIKVIEEQLASTIQGRWDKGPTHNPGCVGRRWATEAYIGEVLRRKDAVLGRLIIQMEGNGPTINTQEHVVVFSSDVELETHHQR